MKKLIIFLSVLIIYCIATNKTVYAQDIHFSQFYASPMSLNPAETGFFEGNWRFTNNYRTQWSAIGVPYNTISAGFDKAFKLNKKSNFGLGVFFINDKSGSSQLTVNKLFLSGNYMLTIDNTHNLGIGVQLGYIVKSFSVDGLTLPSQYNPNTGYFDPDLPNNINIWDENINYPDFNIGFKYNNKASILKPSAGVALFHIINPKESFLRAEDKLPMRFVVHGGVEYALTKKIIINPNIMTMYHKRAGDWVVSTLGYYLMPEGKMIEKIFVGIQGRTAINTFDAIIFTGGVSLYGFDIGLSYDINISKLRAATNNKGAFEISIIYKDLTKNLTKVALPCDRY
ncbi:MAG: PorP/SprF family type IX secretion system membrane protein [Bacteroidales bacterium]|nr:PorP/SprF family type IX secretion system membrane protein [Bacteroidales bacterium]